MKKTHHDSRLKLLTQHSTECYDSISEPDAEGEEMNVTNDGLGGDTPRRRNTYPNRTQLKRAVGRYLLEKFRATGMSRTEAADRAGVSPGYLTGILAGRIVLPGPEIVRRMADHWGFPLLDFYIKTGLINHEDVEEYLSGHELIAPGTPPDVQAVNSLLLGLPRYQREQMAEAIQRMIKATLPQDDDDEMAG
jgi:transcriptional regulator with XRE-family HTH domain